MRVLIFAPHNDDEVLGAGGTIANLAKKGHEIHVCVVTESPDKGLMQKVREEAKAAHAILGVHEVHNLDFEVVNLKNAQATELNGRILEIVEKVTPEMVMIPHKGDMHADHYTVALSAMVAVRPISLHQVKTVYAYETLSETGWNIQTPENIFVPNVYIDITESLQQKLDAMACYHSQQKSFPHPRSLESIRALAKYRGSTVCRKAAEAFMLIREIKDSL